MSLCGHRILIALVVQPSGDIAYILSFASRCMAKLAGPSLYVLASTTFASDFSLRPHNNTSYEGVARPVDELLAFVWRI